MFSSRIQTYKSNIEKLFNEKEFNQGHQYFTNTLRGDFEKAEELVNYCEWYEKLLRKSQSVLEKSTSLPSSAFLDELFLHRDLALKNLSFDEGVSLQEDARSTSSTITAKR